jgi:hypothetical protein
VLYHHFASGQKGLPRRQRCLKDQNASICPQELGLEDRLAIRQPQISVPNLRALASVSSQTQLR